MCVNEEIIKDPGKFEGDPVWVRDLWELTLDRSEDDEVTLDFDGAYASIFYGERWGDPIMPEEFYAVAVWETSSGFVEWCAFDTSAELEKWISDNEYTVKDDGDRGDE